MSGFVRLCRSSDGASFYYFAVICNDRCNYATLAHAPRARPLHDKSDLPSLALAVRFPSASFYLFCFFFPESAFVSLFRDSGGILWNRAFLPCVSSAPGFVVQMRSGAVTDLLPRTSGYKFYGRTTAFQAVTDRVVVSRQNRVLQTALTTLD